MPSEQFISAIMGRTRYILMRWWWWCQLCIKIKTLRWIFIVIRSQPDILLNTACLAVNEEMPIL